MKQGSVAILAAAFFLGANLGNFPAPGLCEETEKDNAAAAALQQTSEALTQLKEKINQVSKNNQKISEDS